MSDVQTVTVHTRIRAGMEAEYDRRHRRIPDDLDAAMRAAGVRSWRIWRDGRDLFHLIEVDDYRAMRRALADDPVNLTWQERINEVLEVVDDYGGEDGGLPLVWALP